MNSITLKYSGRNVLLFQLFIFLISSPSFSQKKYTVQYLLYGKDTSYKIQKPQLKTIFDDEASASLYLISLPQILRGKGFPAASVDSVRYDSTVAVARLYLGEKYNSVEINIDSVDSKVLEAIGWNNKQSGNKMDLAGLQRQEEKIISYYENNGYPFAEVNMENITFSEEKIKGNLIVKKGPLYHIDSIRVFGNAKIKNLFLQHYVEIANGSTYDNSKLKQVSKRIRELPYLKEQQPWDVTMLGSGSILNLYLQQKRSSAIDVLIGYLPANNATGKAQLTGDVHLDLKNALSSGENILLNWQQLQPQSPKLTIGYQHPYIFNSSFGVDFTFNLLKRDSSYLELNTIIGLRYILSANQSGKVFYQNERSYLLSGGVDTNRVVVTRMLPPNIDVSSGNFGISYSFINTNYRLNPRKGNELEVTAAAGIKKVTKNNDIINLKDPGDPAFNFNTLYDSIKLKSYRIRIQGSAIHYIPLGKSSTLKTAFSGGWLETPQVFRNELFQIGGYRLLRGFDEESIYANRYAVFTAEYRYLVG
ncbi:MAG: BamA/TamA family outer membrane protein, partial [Bacteroidota bacterium]|nr:BamA/TamA family outer membrane protein [Bacteroidota bacterium]